MRVKKGNQFYKQKKLSQPNQIKTCGSTFKNVSNDKKAWMLIKDRMYKFKKGDAMISKTLPSLLTMVTLISDIESLIYKVKKGFLKKLELI